MAEVTLLRRKIRFSRLEGFGFQSAAEGYAYQTAIVDGTFCMELTVKTDGRVCSRVTDTGTEEEYVLHLLESAAGRFVGRVREEYRAVLQAFEEECTEPLGFQSEYAQKLISHVDARYGDALEFLWQKFPDNAIWRRKDNEKWYAALLTVSRRKLGQNSDEKIEILDLREQPEEIEKIVDRQRYFPGYHMNKKHWYTIPLDGTVPVEEITGRLEKSYVLAGKKR